MFCSKSRDFLQLFYTVLEQTMNDLNVVIETYKKTDSNRAASDIWAER